jgi:tetraacyldisaccharide 4'-kinase
VNAEKIPSWLLWPLTIPYGAATRLRALLHRARILRQRQLNGAVISVGNLTAGGTGKTPMALWIAERLAAEGKSAAILTRGYRGQSRGNGTTSDEALLLRARLADRVALGIGTDRFARGHDLENQGVRWFVLDDGFQHMQLARDVDIVLIDASNPFGGSLLPAGRRREPRSALRRADIIVITRSTHAPAVEASIRRESRAPVFYAQPELQSVRRLHSGGSPETIEAVDVTALYKRKFFAFCGIGNPGAFLGDVRRWNFKIVGQKFFRDHHRYTQKDMDALVQEAQHASADALLCTEKDAFNLAHVKTNSLDTFYCVISLCVGRADEFWRTIMATVNQRKS